jgi:BioD-like phosphotransacetylase family protein
LITLYVTSIGRHAGKDVIAIGLMDRARRDGFKVTYFKPMGHSPMKLENNIVDKGAWNICELFELKDPVEHICPVVVTQDMIMENYRGRVEGLQEKIVSAFKNVCQQKDLVVVGCDENFSEGSAFGLSGLQLMGLLNAKALFVEKYECSFCVDFILELKAVVGKPMMGVVFNMVETVHLEQINKYVSPFLRQQEIEVFGSIPNDPLLDSIEARELADRLGADVICGKDKLDTLIETFLVGGMQVDKFIGHLLKRTAVGVIVGGDRSDIQLAAIENRVRCLILSGDLYPNETIVARAEVRGVPILVAREDTYSVAKEVESAVGGLGLPKREKIDRAIRLTDQAFDFEKLYGRLKLGHS